MSGLPWGWSRAVPLTARHRPIPKVLVYATSKQIPSRRTWWFAVWSRCNCEALARTYRFVLPALDLLRLAEFEAKTDSMRAM